MPQKDLHKLLERIHLRLDESSVGISHQLAHLDAADLAELLNQLTLAEAATVISMLPVARVIELFDHSEMRRRAPILEQLEPERVAQILEGLSADERTDVIQRMAPHYCHRVLPKLNPQIRKELEGLLQYPAHTAGGIMTTEFVYLNPAMTVGEALKHIRSVAREKESIYACYVLSENTNELLGAVSLRDLVMAELTAPVTEVMRRKPVTVNALDDQELVAKRIAKYNLLAVPVLEKDGSVVGFVTVDDVVDVFVEEQTEDILRMAGVEPGALDKPYFDNPIMRVVRKRIVWLLLLFVAGTLTSAVLHRFEDELAAVVALSFFIPLLIGTGGNAGAQTVMTVIRSLALGEIGMRNAWRVVLREASTGVVVGLLVGAVAFCQALIWQSPLALALTVAVTMLAICLWLTIVDATGLVIYFSIAKIILQQI